jgi:hypothetical protein
MTIINDLFLIGVEGLHCIFPMIEEILYICANEYTCRNIDLNKYSKLKYLFKLYN